MRGFMSKLRDYAKGKECQVRIPGVCNFNPETTVLAHLNQIGISGRSLKAPDQLAAWCCSACHDEVDERTHNYHMWNIPEDEPWAHQIIQLAFLEGIMRTQYELIQKGLIK